MDKTDIKGLVYEFNEVGTNYGEKDSILFFDEDEKGKEIVNEHYAVVVYSPNDDDDDIEILNCFIGQLKSEDEDFISSIEQNDMECGDATYIYLYPDYVVVLIMD